MYVMVPHVVLLVVALVFKISFMNAKKSLVPRPLPFFVFWFAFSIIHGSRRPGNKIDLIWIL